MAASESPKRGSEGIAEKCSDRVAEKGQRASRRERAANESLKRGSERVAGNGQRMNRRKGAANESLKKGTANESLKKGPASNLFKKVKGGPASNLIKGERSFKDAFQRTKVPVQVHEFLKRNGQRCLYKCLNS